MNPSRSPSSAPTVLSAGTSPQLGTLDRQLLRAGDRVGSYRVERELGRGAMGVVFLATDLLLERQVALKVIRPHLLTEGFRERFHREARTMAQVKANEVLTIHTFGEHRGLPYFAMEYVNGVDLEAWLYANPTPPLEQALTIIDDICRGLAAVHAMGAIHRDIKPSNILLDASLHARVADLGLVASVGDDPALVDVAGTPAYMAPELTCGLASSAATQRSDVYALACVAFEVLTGRHPFFDDDDEEPVNRGGRTIPRASEFRRGLPASVDQVLARGLATDPFRRTPTVDSFREQLLAAGLAREPQRILIAEDDPDFLELMRCRLVREFPNAEVECVHDGADLMQAFERQPSSVVIVDLCLPRVDGFRITSLLRAKKEAAEVPIVVLTGAGGARDWATLSELGANRFLVKPVDLDDLVGVTRNVLAGPISRRRALSSDGGASGS